MRNFADKYIEKFGFDEFDITVDAQKILCCIARTGERHRKDVICQVLHGDENQIILDRNLHRQSTYGLMCNYAKEHINALISVLYCNGYIERRYSRLEWGERAYDVVYGKARLYMRISQPEFERYLQFDKEIMEIPQSYYLKLRLCGQ